MSKSLFAAGASTLVLMAAALPSAAGAQVTSQTYGAANALFAPYMRQSEDCYGAPTSLVIQGVNTHSPTTISITPFNYTGSPPFNCATTHVNAAFQLNTMATTSGAATKALFSHDAKTYLGDTLPPGGNNTPWPTVNFVTSEVALGPADVTVYVSGGVELGVTFSPTPGAGQYPIPAPRFGPMIQFPLDIAPLAIVYDSTYKRVRNADNSVTSYHLHLHHPRPDGSGGLVLDAATYCAIFNGEIMDWNQIPLALNGGESLKDPADPQATFSLPLVPVGRSDSAAATATLSRHLAAICPTVVSGNQYPDAATTLPPILVNIAWNKANPNFGAGSGVTDIPGKFTLAQGVDGEVDYIQFDPNNLPGPNAGDTVTQGRIGYDGNDQVLPFVTATGNNTFGLNSASLLRAGNATPVSPTGATANLAFSSAILPPAPANRSHPDLWVQPSSKSAQIAIPSNPKAYPFVNTANFVGPTCYADAAVTTNLTAFLYWYESNTIVESTTLGILHASGSSPLPAAWRTAIEQTFLRPTAITKPLNLYILQAGTGPTTGTGSQCNAITPGG